MKQTPTIETKLDNWKSSLRRGGQARLITTMKETLTEATLQEFVNKQSPQHLLDFICLAEHVRRQEILDWLDQYQQNRFAAKPIYGPTGNGFLHSRGVADIIEEKNLADALAQPKPSAILDAFYKEVTTSIMRRLKSPTIKNLLGL